MRITLETVYTIAEEFLEREYGFKLAIPIRIDGRMKRSFGMFMHVKGGESREIKLSKEMMEYHSLEKIIETIKHECIHYVLYETGKPFLDSDTYFQNELKRHGCALTGTQKFAGRLHVYSCTGCEAEIKRMKRFNIHNYKCRRCKSRWEYVGEKVMEG